MLMAASLAVVLTAQPAFLTTEARRVRLTADAPVAEPPELSDYRGWTKAQLRAEYDRLAATRPGVGLPIALMASGGGAFLFGFYLFVGVGGFNGGPGQLPLLILLGVTATVAAIAIVIGGIVLSRLLPERRAIGRQMDLVERLAESKPDEVRRRRGEEEAPPPFEEPPIIGPPPEGPPPLPLPPMPQSAASTLPLFLARF